MRNDLIGRNTRTAFWLKNYSKVKLQDLVAKNLVHIHLKRTLLCLLPMQVHQHTVPLTVGKHQFTFLIG